MFHVCTSIVFDFILHNPGVSPAFLHVFMVNLRELSIGGRIPNFQPQGTVLCISNHIRDYWRQIPLAYKIVEEHDIVSAWMKVCLVVAEIVAQMGIHEIYSDINQACYQVTDANGNYIFDMFSPEERSWRGVHIDSDSIPYSYHFGNHTIDNWAHEDMYSGKYFRGGPYVGAWQQKFDRDYLIPVFYIDADYKKMPMRAYKTLFDRFRLNFYGLRSLHSESLSVVTKYEHTLLNANYASWGLCVATKLLMKHYLARPQQLYYKHFFLDVLSNINVLLTINTNSSTKSTFETISQKIHNICIHTQSIYRRHGDGYL